jgi:hypothetical protein
LRRSIRRPWRRSRSTLTVRRSMSRLLKPRRGRVRLVFCGGSQGLVLAARSPEKVTIAIDPMNPQVAHSKVRSSTPRAPGVMRARAILCLLTGHIGRSFGELIRLIPALDVHTLCRIGGGFQSRSERQCCGRIGPAGRAKMPACVASPPSLRPPNDGAALRSRGSLVQ